MKKKFITIALVIVMIFVTTTTVFASSDSETIRLVVEKYPGIQNIIDSIYTDGDTVIIRNDESNNNILYIYSIPNFSYLDTSNVLHLSVGGYYPWVRYYISSGYTESGRKGNGGTTNSFYPVTTFLASNKDIFDQNGNLVFRQTPLAETNLTLVGGITSKQLQAPLMTILTSLLILVTSLVILAMAFRKGWNLLLTVLKGA